MHRYFEISRPLTDLLKKDNQWQWGLEQQAAFDFLKSPFTHALIMGDYDSDRQEVLETDASDLGEARYSAKPVKMDSYTH